MNASILRYYIVDALGGGVDAGISADAILSALALRGIDLDTEGDARTSALVALALCPEHVRKMPDLTPAERLRVFEGLARVAPDVAGAYRTQHAPQIEIATSGRERDRFLMAERKADADAAVWQAQKRLATLNELLRVEELKAKRLTDQLNGPFAPTARPALSQTEERIAAIKWEAKGLERVISEAGALSRGFAAGGR